jgi:hypothetical protein
LALLRVTFNRATEFHAPLIFLLSPGVLGRINGGSAGGALLL